MVPRSQTRRAARPQTFAAVLKAPHVDAVPVADNPIKNGCGWVNSVRVASAGGAAIGLDK